MKKYFKSQASVQGNALGNLQVLVQNAFMERTELKLNNWLLNEFNCGGGCSPFELESQICCCIAKNNGLQFSD